jgi:hypothetical protein
MLLVDNRKQPVEQCFSTGGVGTAVGSQIRFRLNQQQGREADHPPPSSAEVKNGGSIHPLPSMSLWRSA